MNSEGTSITIIGTEIGCGKTVLMCGLAGALREQGYQTRALKPVILGGRRRAEPELSFITQVTQTRANYPISFLERPTSIHETNIHNVVLLARKPDHVTFVELPGGAATPVSYEINNAGKLTPVWRDCCDLALEFESPTILVAKHQPDALERLVIACSYLQTRGLTVIGLVTVETLVELGQELEAKTTRGDFTIGLYSKTRVPYLGCVKFSQSISVPRVNQGNVIKQAQNGIDLLLLMKSLNLPVPQVEPGSV